MPPSAASVTAQAPSSPRIATNNFAKTETRRRPASQHHTAGSRSTTPPARAGRVARSPVIARRQILQRAHSTPGFARGGRCPPPRSAMPPSAASVTAQAPSSPRIATNNFAKTETRRRPASQHHTAGSRSTTPPARAAPHRRLAQHHTAGSRRSRSSIPCYCRRSPSRARVRTAITVNGVSAGEFGDRWSMTR